MNIILGILILLALGPTLIGVFSWLIKWGWKQIVKMYEKLMSIISG